MLKQILLVLFTLFYWTTSTFSQTQSNKFSYSKDWNTIDSLMDNGFPKSAQPAIEKIYSNAKNGHDIPTSIKAQIYLLKAKYDNEENSTKLQLKDMEALANNTTGVEKSIWQSLTADMYFSYYQNNRYELYNRTKLATTISDDIDTWDAAAILEYTAALYEASLSQKELLQATTVEQYEPLITKGINTKGLRPTLYDILVFKAIDFFENDETGVSQAANDFQMDGTLWFENAERFSSVRVKVKDASSFKFRALRLFQNIIAFHLNDKDPEALIDADLLRLQFVHGNNINAKNDSLYISALQATVNQYTQYPATAQASYLIINEKINGAFDNTEFESKNTRKKDRHLPQFAKELQEVIAKFSNSEGAINAQNLLKQLSTKELSLQTEQVNIPNENIKALITYRNLPTAYFSLYRLPYKVKDNDDDADSLLAKLRQLTPVKSWQQMLPGMGDMEAHSTEIKIDALPSGNYIIVAGSENAAFADSQIVVYTAFQVSNISFIIQQEKDKKGFVLNRKTGYPLANVKSCFYEKNYNSKGREYVYSKLGNSISDADGIIQFPDSGDNGRHSIQGMLFVNGNDSLFMNGGLYNGKPYKPQQRNDTTTFFFTDRAIYRPGQTLYFKGIMVKSTYDHRENEIVADHNTIVNLYDVNSQKKGSINLKTNEFGSFTGSFQLSEGLLNGTMRISNDKGDISFSVEEYKRPKFYIDFDTLKGSYALNENVTVKGFAKAYAGNSIDGAQVKYRVVRKVIFPYYWCYYLAGTPTTQEVEIAHGNTISAADGSFNVSFETMPDQSIDAKTMPLFHYFVYADVTDINGETHSGNVQVNSGYTTLQISTTIEEESKPKDLQQLDISTQNLNGIFTPAIISISIAHLKSPGFLRERLWEMPDEYAMTETEFHKAFPNDEYKNESNHLNWEIDKVLFEKTWTTIENEKLNIPVETWYQNGWYLIEIKTKDAKGNEIVEKKYTHVWAPGKKEQTQEPIVAYTEKDSYEPGDKIELWLSTAVDQPHILQSSSIAYQVRNPINIDVQEKDRGGITFSWLYVYNNRVYTLDKKIDVPWSNKDLQLEWATHRDKLQPGAKEEWTLTVKGNKKEKVAAELLAGMYDASLDAFQPHSWSWNKLFPYVYKSNVWNDNWGFSDVSSDELISLEYENDNFYKSYNDLSFEGVLELRYDKDSLVSIIHPRSVAGTANPDAIDPGLAPPGNNFSVRFAPSVLKKNEEMKSDEKPESPDDNTQNENDKIHVRKNLQETAFFFPQLKTDTAGNVSFSFTIPEALTEWKLMAFAHSKDWKTGYLTGKVKTQKDLMVMPNLPRFLRQNDNIQISCKIVNLSDRTLKGDARIELLDAQTLQPILLAQFQQSNWSANEGITKPFNIDKGQSSSVTWNLHIPESRYTPVIVRITAKSGSFSDGEENTLPVITNRTLVTETMPISIKGNANKIFTLDKLLNNTSNTLSNHSLTVEFTGNPAWYAVEALPYLMEYPYECAEQTFNRFYANALAQNIVAQSPKVQQIFNQWQQKDSAALISNLQKNEDLKTALLEETPWVMDAQNETEQKHKMALLFQTSKMAKELDMTIDKLGKMQLSDGSFPWFKGMNGDRFITQYILTGMGRLQYLNVKNIDKKDVQQMYSKALDYTDEQMQQEYNDLLKSKADMQAQHLYSSQIQYLYMRSFYSENPLSDSGKVILNYYKKQAAKYWPQFNSYLKAQIALALNRMDNTKTALQIMQSLKETAIQNDESGMYWKDMTGGYNWNEAPIESEAVLIEAFSEITKDNDAVDAMKLWLLKQKQTQNWETTKATADACYALLLNGSNWLANQPTVTIQLGNQTISTSKVATEAGSGYFQQKFLNKEVTKEMGNIKVNVQYPASDLNNHAASWGAVYWQYFEDMDKVTTMSAPISMSKQLFIEQNTDKGSVLTIVEQGNELKVGDKVKIRIVVKVDRDMEYVQLKDMRAACFEPVDVLSGYKYQNGVGYYQSTKDLSTNFFFDHLYKGTYVFEYPVWVNAKGNFSNGISTIQCMYAPDFSSHTEGIRVDVK